VTGKEQRKSCLLFLFSLCLYWAGKQHRALAGSLFASMKLNLPCSLRRFKVFFKRFSNSVLILQLKIAQNIGICPDIDIDQLKMKHVSVKIRTNCSSSSVFKQSSHFPPTPSIYIYKGGGQTCSIYEPHIVKPKLQRAANIKILKHEFICDLRFCDIIILFGTTCRSNTVRQSFPNLFACDPPFSNCQKFSRPLYVFYT